MSALNLSGGLRGKSIFWIVAALGTVVDLVTKSVVFRMVDERGRIPIVEGFFYFSQAENPGGVFGLFAEWGGVLMAVRALALLVIFWFVLQADASQRMAIWAFGCLFAGALGNLWDNVFNDGHVRDWLQFFLLPPNRGEFPTFNVADILINVGVGLLLLHEFRAPKQKSPQG